MIAMTIQCPTCGLQLRHGKKLLDRVAGRRGATRCPGCRDRVFFDATGAFLKIEFPDLVERVAQERSTTIVTETVPPPEVSEERVSRVVPRHPVDSMPYSSPGALMPPRVPWELMHIADDGEPVFPLLLLKNAGQKG